jgi:hypothetical protein
MLEKNISEVFRQSGDNPNVSFVFHVSFGHDALVEPLNLVTDGAYITVKGKSVRLMTR